MYKNLMTFAFLGAFSLMSGAHADADKYQCKDPSTQKAYNACKEAKNCPPYDKNDPSGKQCRKECQEKTGCVIERPVQ